MVKSVRRRKLALRWKRLQLAERDADQREGRADWWKAEGGP